MVKEAKKKVIMTLFKLLRNLLYNVSTTIFDSLIVTP